MAEATVAEATMADGAAEHEAEEPSTSSSFHIRKSMSYRLKSDTLRADCFEALVEMGMQATGQEIIDYVVEYGGLTLTFPPSPPSLPASLPWTCPDTWL